MTTAPRTPRARLSVAVRAGRETLDLERWARMYIRQALDAERGASLTVLPEAG